MNQSSNKESESIQIPNSPQEIFLKNHKFSNKELFDYFKKLDYSDQDEFISMILHHMKNFYRFMIEKNEEESDSEEKMNLLKCSIHDFSLMKSMIEIHNMI